MSDSDESQEHPGPDLENVGPRKEEPPPGVTGLALAEYYFGPLLSPVAATPAQWTTYTESRLGTNAKYSNVFDRPKQPVSDAVAAIENELRLDKGALQKCISIVERYFDPCVLNTLVRIHSPTTPKHVDVHIKYHYRPRSFEIEWFYSLGYKIQNRISSSPAEYNDPTTGLPYMWHARGGWQSICWGYFDDAGHRYARWRRIEVSDMGLHEEGVLDIHEALFGPIEKPLSDDPDAVLAYRRRLVATVRLLFAAVGIRYKVACTDEETDDRPVNYRLEGSSDRWVARGIRSACGFQLSGDAEAAIRGQKERREEAAGEEDERDGLPDDSGIDYDSLATAIMRFFT